MKKILLQKRIFNPIITITCNLIELFRAELQYFVRKLKTCAHCVISRMDAYRILFFQKRAFFHWPFYTLF